MVESYCYSAKCTNYYRCSSGLHTPHFSDFSAQFLIFVHLLGFFHFDVLVSWYCNVNDDALPLLLVYPNSVWPFSLEESVDIDVEIPQYSYLIVFQSHFLADACTGAGCVATGVSCMIPVHSLSKFIMSELV